LIDLQGKVGMKLSEIPEQDSYSYATAFIYLGANSQKELVDKFQQCRKMLKFQFEEPIPVVSPDQAQDQLPETAPQVAIQVLTSPIQLPEQHVPIPHAGGVQDLVKP
ncbi:MAG: D-alanine--D-alanine ligase, partial [Thermodesulfobacteriota bacterium]